MNRLGFIVFLSIMTSAHFLPSKSQLAKFPKLVEFFKKKPEYRRKSILSQCEVDIHREQCVFKSTPRKNRCLVLRNVVAELIPQYKVALNSSELSNFKMQLVTAIFIDTCTKRVTFKTAPDASFVIIPKVLQLKGVEASVSVSMDQGDYQLFGTGSWTTADLQMKLKFTKEQFDHYSLKGFSEIDLVPVSRIADLFDVDVVPKGPLIALLGNLHVESFALSKCRVYGFVQPIRKNFELVITGHPNEPGFERGHMKLFITKNGAQKNLALLLELSEYSPVRLLKKIYGPAIEQATVLRDRNQTIALYISSAPTANFSSTFTSHGSARWIHRDSSFAPGAHLLVTLPFPRRKALDMKIGLKANSLDFRLPENERLSGDLILGAISPTKIMHLGVDTYATRQDTTAEKYSRMRVLQFRYFLFNDTYRAAVESHLTERDELTELMPARDVTSLIEDDVRANLDAFFKREESGNVKRQVNEKRDNYELKSKNSATNLKEHINENKVKSASVSRTDAQNSLPLKSLEKYTKLSSKHFIGAKNLTKITTTDFKSMMTALAG